MPFVLDASVSICWAFDEEDHGTPDLALKRLDEDEDQALVPALWWFEVRNILVINERRGRISRGAVSGFLGVLGEMSVSPDHAPEETTILHLARSHRLAVYDAAYLELALRRSLPLATLDRALARAAQSEGVALIGS